MAPDRIFKTLEEFNCGYAGPQTLLLEQRCRELGGRQDNFCLICGDTEQELFPQLGPKEIHLCPRRFCKKCYWIDPGWKKDSDRFQSECYKDCTYLTLCCALCWKRGWDFSNPLLGRDQPHWQGHTKEDKEDVLRRRYFHWEECAADKGYGSRFKWRLPLLKVHDDMSLESDQNLIQTLKIPHLKKTKRSKLFGSKPTQKGWDLPTVAFDVGTALTDIKRVLCELETSDMFQGEQEEQEWRERNQGEEAEEIDHVQQSLPPPIVSRPQRQASRLSFVTGQPIRREPDMLDRQISSPVASGSPPSQVDLAPHMQNRTNDTPRPRGRPRKTPAASIPLPPSPSTQDDDTAPGSSFAENEVVDDAESEPDQDFNQARAMFNRILDQSQMENRRLREEKARQKAQLRLMEEELERTRANVQDLEQVRIALSAAEIGLRDALSASEVEKQALQSNIADLRKQHEFYSQNIAEITANVVDQRHQIEDVQRLRQDIEDCKQKLGSVEADLQASKFQNAKLNDEVVELREAHDIQLKDYEELEERYNELITENQGFSKGIVRRDREIVELKRTTGTVDRKSTAIRTLREGHDEFMEANKQLQKDLANLTAELAVDRDLEDFDGTRLQQALSRGSLTSDLVDRLVQNPFLKDQMTAKPREPALEGESFENSQSSQTIPRKRRRVGPVGDTGEPSWPRGDSELYDS